MTTGGIPVTSHLISTEVKGINSTPTDVPFPNGKGMHALLELVDTLGNGECYEAVLPSCITTSSKQRCDI